jgi:outer membrane immunogenic protein
MRHRAIVAAITLLAMPGTAALAQSTGANSGSADGWVAGVHAGYNWQSGAPVFGIETDISGTALKTNFNTALTGNVIPVPTANTSANIDYFGTLRGRLGWSAGSLLFYGTGGLAYGSVDLNSTLVTPQATSAVQVTDLRIGWVAGAGIEYKWLPNVIFSLNYQYVDLGTETFSVPVAVSPSAAQSGTEHARLQAVTVGVSWLFTPDGKGAHGPWQGAYIGGHAGGDWGNTTSASYLGQVLLSDIRLKRDITLIGHLDDGLGLYRYRYVWGDTVYVGVMAQEVAGVRPDAVALGDDGYLRVDYRKLGLQLRTQAEWDALTYEIAIE